MRLGLSFLLGLAIAPVASGQPLTLREEFLPDGPKHIRLQTDLTGRLTVPKPGSTTPEVVPFVGRSLVEYDERPLTPAADGADRVVRLYQTVELARTIGDREEAAEVRPEVRRMVVLRGTGSVSGKKVPFSPDGPLTLGEIEVVRVDLFCPVLVAGLLPANPVDIGAKWPVGDEAARELTGYAAVEANKLEVELLAVVELNGRRLAKLRLTGTVAGLTDDGPSRQTLDGTGYFDLNAKFLSYLKITGRHQLLGPGGVTAGEVTGVFTLTRSVKEPDTRLSAVSLKDLDLQPNEANSRLLYDDPSIGLKFLYPRGWRIGLTEGAKLVLDESGGQSGMVLTVLPPERTPTPEAYKKGVEAIAAQEKWTLAAPSPPTADPVRPDVVRFGYDVTKKPGATARQSYAVLTTPVAGATAAIRIAPGANSAHHSTQADEIVRSIVLTRPSE